MNMRLTAAIVALGLTSVAVWAQTGQQVNYNGTGGTQPGGSRYVTDSQGNRIPFGNDVEIGFFNGMTEAQVQAAVGSGGVSSLQNLWANWVPFDTTTFQPFIFDGNVAGEFNGVSPTKFDSAFNNQPIYLWIFQTVGNVTPNTTTFANVIQWGLFRDSGPGTTWTFPSTTAAFNNPVNITTSQVDLAFYGGITLPGGTDATGSLTLAAVPEPTGLALLGLGLAVVVSRRARR